jgi:hypothetical protein
MKRVIIATAMLCFSGCASITNDPMVPVALSFSNGAYGKCDLSNKRGAWSTSMPNTVSIRRSDDQLQYRCRTDGGQDVAGAIPSTMGGKIVASAIFLDFGIVDSITDKHREYPASFVIPVPAPEKPASEVAEPADT